MDIDAKRAPAVIDSITYDDERFTTLCVMINGRDGGWGQGFGSIMFDSAEARRDFVRDLCATFGVADPEALPGKPCFVLKCFSGWNERIEGLESEATGRRFVLTDWCKARWPGNVQDPLTYRRESLERDVVHFTRRIADARRALLKIDGDYTEWHSS